MLTNDRYYFFRVATLMLKGTEELKGDLEDFKRKLEISFLEKEKVLKKWDSDLVLKTNDLSIKKEELNVKIGSLQG